MVENDGSCGTPDRQAAAGQPTRRHSGIDKKQKTTCGWQNQKDGAQENREGTMGEGIRSKVVLLESRIEQTKVCK